MSSLALAAVSAVTALGFVRVFEEPEAALVPMGAALLAHLTVRVGARRAPGTMTLTALAAGLVLYSAWTVEPETTFYGLPTGETLAALTTGLPDGFAALERTSVPAPGTGPLLLLALVGVWLSAVAAEWVATNSRAVLSALIPSVTMFTLTAALGTDSAEVPLSAAMVAACLLFVLLHAPAQAGGEHAWFSGGATGGLPGGNRSGRFAVLRAGVPVVIVAAALAPVLGPRLPDAESVGLVERDGNSGPRTRVTVSPLVDIRDRLTQRPAVEVFTVRADAPAYWRLAALDAFDGTIWSSLASYRSASGRLPSDTEVAPITPLVQEFSISNLAQFWLPAAYRPVAIDLQGARVNPESMTLLTEQQTADGLTYRVTSDMPSYSPSDFAAAPRGAVPESLLPSVQLPGGISPDVHRLAREITNAAPDFYGKARALQDFFRGNFTYSEGVPAGHSSAALEDFLFVHRSGFCEQFSAAFAVMARSLGMPARVAVGFQPGTLEADGRFHVRSTDAHAWPEVHIEPFGWVAFEPTPSRTHPSPANHTGTYDPDAQAPLATPTTVASTPTTVAPVPDDDGSVPPTSVDRSPTEPGTSNPWLRRAGILAALVAGVVVAGGLVVFAVRRTRRLARRRNPDTRAAVLAAWEELVERLRAEGVDVRASRTPAEIERSVARRFAPLAEPMADLRPIVDAAAYGAGEPDRVAAGRAWRAVDSAVAVLDAHEPRRSRLARALDPRGLRER